MLKLQSKIRKETKDYFCKGEKMDNNQSYNQQPYNQQQAYQQQAYQQQAYQQQAYQQAMYQQPMYQAPYQSVRPFRPMRNDRSLWTYLLLGILTCGIYYIVFFSDLADDVNYVASPRDGKKLMHYCLMYFIVSPLTCGIYTFIWFHSLSERVGDEARARGIDTNFGAGSFWLWYVLGLFFFVGPFIYIYQLCETMNMISEDYNRRGF